MASLQGLPGEGGALSRTDESLPSQPLESAGRGGTPERHTDKLVNREEISTAKSDMQGGLENGVLLCYLSLGSPTVWALQAAPSLWLFLQVPLTPFLGFFSLSKQHPKGAQADSGVRMCPRGEKQELALLLCLGSSEMSLSKSAVGHESLSRDQK